MASLARREDRLQPRPVDPPHRLQSRGMAPRPSPLYGRRLGSLGPALSLSESSFLGLLGEGHTARFPDAHLLGRWHFAEHTHTRHAALFVPAVGSQKPELAGDVIWHLPVPSLYLPWHARVLARAVGFTDDRPLCAHEDRPHPSPQGHRRRPDLRRSVAAIMLDF